MSNYGRHRWLRNRIKQIIPGCSETRAALYVCVHCSMAVAHFYHMFENMAHALEIENVPYECDGVHTPNELTHEQMRVYYAYVDNMRKHGPVYASAIAFFRDEKRRRESLPAAAASASAQPGLPVSTPQTSS
jgi:hypothetical protein